MHSGPVVQCEFTGAAGGTEEQQGPLGYKQNKSRIHHECRRPRTSELLRLWIELDRLAKVGTRIAKVTELRARDASAEERLDALRLQLQRARAVRLPRYSTFAGSGSRGGRGFRAGLAATLTRGRSDTCIIIIEFLENPHEE